MQLDSQRLFFEERLKKMEEKANFQLEETEIKLMDYMDDNLKLKTNLQQMIKEKITLEKKYTTVSFFNLKKVCKVTNQRNELNEIKVVHMVLRFKEKLHMVQENLIDFFRSNIHFFKDF